MNIFKCCKPFDDYDEIDEHVSIRYNYVHKMNDVRKIENITPEELDILKNVADNPHIITKEDLRKDRYVIRTS